MVRFKLARFIIVAAAVSFLMPAAAAEAQEARGLTVFPPNIVLDGNAGQSIERTIAIENSSAVGQRVSVGVRNFKPTLEEGQAAPTEEDSSYSMVHWMTVSPTSLELKAGERREVKVTIAVPANAEAGSHFGSVIFTPTTLNSEFGSFRTTTEVASLILLRLPGATNEAASVVSFDAKVAGKDAGPIEFATRIKNDGTVHFVPTGEITITDTFGRKVKTIPVNDSHNPVLPGAIRRYDNIWEGKNLVGLYKAKLRLTYASNTPGAPEKVLTAETSFDVIPPVFLALTLAGVCVGGFVVFAAIKNGRLRRRSRRSNQADV